MPFRAIRCRVRSTDSGFTLIESIVALALAVIIFMALSFALISGEHQVLLSQQNQQAADVLNQYVEKARALTFDQLVMQQGDLNTNDPLGLGSMATPTYNPSTNSTSGGEKISYAAVGGLVPHVAKVLQNGGAFWVRQYVTVPTDNTQGVGYSLTATSNANYKRYTAVVSWTSLGRSHTRTYSSIFAYTKSGLPLPSFNFTNSSPLNVCRNPGSTVTFTLTVSNQGARDSYLLSTSSTNPSWSFYKDNNGTYDPLNPLATDSTTGLPTTGTIETGGSQTFDAVATLNSEDSTPPPYSLNVTFTATSAASKSYSQPSQQTVNTTTTVQSAACGSGSTPTPTATATPTPTPTPTPTSTAPTQPTGTCTTSLQSVNTSAPGGTMVRYWMYNPSEPGNTNASSDMPVLRDSATAPTQATLYAYSQDLSANAGRYVSAPAGVNTTAAYLATWLYGMPQTSTLKGTGEITLWAAPQNFSSTATPSLQVKLDDVSGTSVTNLSTSTFSASSGWGCNGFRPVSIPIGGSGTQLANNGYSVGTGHSLRITVSVTNSVPMVLAYGTSSFRSEFSLPYSNGNG